MSSQSFFCTPELCEKVFLGYEDSIRNRIEVEGRQAFAFAVINPTLTYAQAENRAMSEEWTGAFIWESAIGKSPDLEAYIVNARLKALEALFHRESLLQVWLHRPAALRKGKIGWYGGIYRHGIAAGGSGLIETSDDELTDFLVQQIHWRIKDASQWRSPAARITQLREWGGLLGGKS